MDWLKSLKIQRRSLPHASPLRDVRHTLAQPSVYATSSAQPQRRILREIGPGSKCWFAGESRVSRPPAARRRKLLTCALRGCRHRSRCSSASATGRGSSSTSLRVAAPQFRRSRGAVHATAQVLANVQLEVGMSSTRGRQSISGACCTLPPLVFCLTLVPRCRLQEAASADGDLRWRAEPGGLQMGYKGNSWTLDALRLLISWSLVVCASVSHVAVACDGSSFEG